MVNETPQLLSKGQTHTDKSDDHAKAHAPVVLLESHGGDLLERLLDVGVGAGTGLEVREGLGLLVAPLFSLGLANTALTLRLVDLVSEDNEREVFGVAGHGLDQELLAPAVELTERLLVGDVVHQHAGVGAAVEGDAQTLEALLASSVPDLHGDKLVLNHHLLREEVGTDGRFVLVGELAVDVLVHQRRLADTTVAKDDHLEKDFLAVSHFGSCV